MPFDLALPAACGRVLDELLLDVETGAEPGCVVAGGEKLRAGQHQVALARTLSRRAQAVAEFELGLEEVRLQPRQRFGVEAVLAQCVGGRPGEGDVGSEVPVEGVLVLLFNGRVGQA
jgi:hypothetical protein